MEEESITAKELIPIVLACAVWGRHWVQGQLNYFSACTKVLQALFLTCVGKRPHRSHPDHFWWGGAVWQAMPGQCKPVTTRRSVLI